MSAIDTTKNASDNLLALILAANPGSTLSGLTSADIDWQAQTEQAPDGEGRNTSINAQAAAGSAGFRGVATVTYTRRGVTDSVVSPNWATSVTDGVTDAEIIAAIALANGLIGTELTIVGDITRPAGEVLTSTVALNTNAGSLLYIDGTTQEVTLNWNDTRTDLATAVAVTALSGFDAAS